MIPVLRQNPKAEQSLMKKKPVHCFDLAPVLAPVLISAGLQEGACFGDELEEVKSAELVGLGEDDS